MLFSIYRKFDVDESTPYSKFRISVRSSVGFAVINNASNTINNQLHYTDFASNTLEKNNFEM